MKKKSAKDIFDTWALDYHAEGMEKGHWQSVSRAFREIPESDGNYLEIGFGNGYGLLHMTEHQYRNGLCYGLDISPNMAEITQKRLQAYNNVHLDTGNFLTWIPPVAVRFSCIFSMEVFYYFQDIQDGIDRAVSFLDPAGMLMVLVNYYTENTVTHSWPNDLGTRMTLWSASQYREGFEKAGLVKIRQIRLPGGDGLGTLCTWGKKD
ncbi:class I SAM-dependent methyltransferase [bacterium]|nr:class I SAM-dependent methyltransferase [bacterium]